MKLVTWNIDGSSADGENKYNAVKDVLRTKSVDVLCLQECGTFPAGVEVLRDNQDVKVGLWNLGSQSRPEKTHFIARFNWDVNSNRVHPAVAWRKSLTPQFNVMNPPTLNQVDNPLPDGRPAIGVTINGTSFYSIHAFAGNGNDGPPLLKEIDQQETNNWVVAGDYNREPDSLHKKIDGNGMTIWPPGGPTKAPNKNAQPAKTYDYAVTDVNQSRTGTVSSSDGKSDHWPVTYDL